MTEARDTLFGESQALLLVPTNRFNLLEMLSSRMIAPRAAYTKYYADLLEAAPGRVPIVAGGIPEDVVDLISSETQTAFPVAVELDRARLDRLPIDAKTSPGGTDKLTLDDPAADGWAPRTILPLAAARAIHFRSSAELDEHRLREHENIRDDLEYAVSPDIFGRGSPGFAAWVSELPSAGPTAESFDQADRLSGGMAVLAGSLPSEIAWLDGYVELVRPDRPRRKKRNDVIPPWLRALVVKPSDPASDLNTRFATAAVSALLRFSIASRWRPLEVLAQVKQALADLLTGQELAALSSTFAAMEAILRNEQDFEGFRREKGLAAQKALLLVLLRPQPERLLAWDLATVGADDETRVGAAFFSGLVVGRKQLSVKLRPERLDDVLAHREIYVLNPDDRLAKPDQWKTSVARDDSSRTLTILLNDAELITRPIVKVPLAETLRNADLEHDRAMRGKAIEVCRRLGWIDCVQTVVRASASELNVSCGQHLEVRLPGFAETDVVLQVDRFRERLETEDLPGIEG